jgi:hypothetical protein
MAGKTHLVPDPKGGLTVRYREQVLRHPLRTALLHTIYSTTLLAANLVLQDGVPLVRAAVVCAVGSALLCIPLTYVVRGHLVRHAAELQRLIDTKPK